MKIDNTITIAFPEPQWQQLIMYINVLDACVTKEKQNTIQYKTAMQVLDKHINNIQEQWMPQHDALVKLRDIALQESIKKSAACKAKGCTKALSHDDCKN